MREEERFMNFVYPDPNTGCWLWSGADNGHGHGGFRRSPENGSKWSRAHRVSYQLFIGEIPDGKILDHLFRVRCCVNPNHLEAVTYKENSQRGLTGINQTVKTHCPSGHPYGGDNLYLRPDGGRGCKLCLRESKRKFLENKND